jgi:hypothetical protein
MLVRIGALSAWTGTLGVLAGWIGGGATPAGSGLHAGGAQPAALLQAQIVDTSDTADTGTPPPPPAPAEAPLLTVTTALTPVSGCADATGSGSVADVCAADVLDWAITVTNAGGQAENASLRLRDANVFADAIPTLSATFEGIPLPFNTAFDGDDLLLTFPVLPDTRGAAGGVVITLSGAEIRQNLGAGNTRELSATLEAWQDADGALFLGPTADSATLTSRAITGTVTSTTTTSPTIAELVPYTLDVYLPPGQHGASSLSFLLPVNFPLQQAPVVTTSGVSVVGASGPTVTQVGRNVVWSASGLEVAPGTTGNVHVTFQAVPLNNVTSDAGDTLDFAPVFTSALAETTTTLDAPDLVIGEADLRAPVSLDVGSGDAGDTITVTVTVEHTETSSATAHDVTLAFPIPAELEDASGLRKEFGRQAFTYEIISGLVVLTFVDFPIGDVSVYAFDARISDAAPIGGVLDAVVELDWTSRPGSPGSLSNYAGDTSNERNGTRTPTYNDYYRETASPLELIQTSGAITRTTAATAVVGDAAAWHVDATLPEGLAPNFELQVDLPDGLAFTGASGFTASASLACDGAACTLPTPVVTNNGRTVRFPLGFVENLNRDNGTLETVAFDLGAVVDNRTGAARGAALSPILRVGAGSLVAEPVTVREPDLTAALTFDSATVDAGDALGATLTFGHIAASDADAHDVALSLTLPTGVVAANGALATSCGDATVASNVLTWSAATLPLGTTCAAALPLTIAANVAPGANLTLPASRLSWTSQAGSTTSSASPYTTTAVERTGDTSAPGGAANRYALVIPGSTLAVPAAAGTLTLTSSDSTATDGTDFAIGETFSWTYTLTLPESAGSNLTLGLTPNFDARFTSVSVDTSSYGGTLANTPAGAVTHTAGSTLTLAFGNYAVPADSNPNNGVLRVTVQGLAAREPFTWNLPSTLDATLSINGATATVTTATYAVLHPEPTLRLETASLTPTAGQTVLVEAIVDNAGDGLFAGASFDVEILDGLAVVSPDADGLDNDLDGATDEADEAAIRTGPAALRWELPAAFAAGATRRYPFAVVVPAIPGAGALDVAATLGLYNTLPGGLGQLLDPETDDIDTNLDGIPDEAGDATSTLSLLPDEPVLRLTKAYADANGGSVEPNDLLTFTITMQNSGNRAATGVVLRDDSRTFTVAPEVVGSLSAPNGTLTLTSAGFEVDYGSLPAGVTRTVTFQVRVATPLPAGTTFSNQAFLTYDGYPTLASDDPRTATAADATRVVVASTNDPDGDGIASAVEGLYRTNPNDPDTDDDGIPDGVEIVGPQRTDPTRADSDRDGACDGPATIANPGCRGAEDANGNGIRDPGETNPNAPDTDGDGLTDGEEVLLGTNGTLTDTDGDGLSDQREVNGRSSPIDADSDDDGLSDGDEVNVYDTLEDEFDTDGDGLSDGQEVALGTDPNSPDSDDDGVTDGDEVANGTAPLNADTDTDGLTDGEERTAGTNPLDTDSDDDGVTDGDEAALGTAPLVADTDGDGLTDGQELGIGTQPTTADSDNDGLNDGAELNLGTNPLAVDTDGDGLEDGEEVFRGSDPFDPDTDGDGLNDGADVAAGGSPTQADSDGDGLSDAAEAAGGTSLGDADTDDDGLSDGDEAAAGTNALDPDSDDDGVSDGLEVANGTDPNSADTDGDGLSDGEEAALGTDPNDPDTDGDGTSDGDEAAAGTDPGNVDADGDGLTNEAEVQLGTDPNDADSDDDGLSDGDEVAIGSDPNDVDTDDDGLTDLREVAQGTDPTRADTDNDGLSDGEEAALGTDPTTPDTDGDGIVDGVEAANGTPAGDADADDDGLSDTAEAAYGTDPADPDSDDDGINDGDELQLGLDPLHPDSDGDGISDGLEAANGTDPNDALSTTPDVDTDGDGLADAAEADAGTDPNDADSDNDGRSDGEEVGAGTDPNDAESDNDGASDGL